MLWTGVCLSVTILWLEFRVGEAMAKPEGLVGNLGVRTGDSITRVQMQVFYGSSAPFHSWKFGALDRRLTRLPVTMLPSFIYSHRKSFQYYLSHSSVRDFVSVSNITAYGL